MGIRSNTAAKGGGFNRKRRKVFDADVDFTSLIDVVFLLLIFFMVNTAIQPETVVKVPPARHGKTVDPALSTTITLLEPRQPGARSPIVLGDDVGHELTMDDVEREIKRGLAEGKRQVIIKAEKKVPHRDVLQVAQMVGAVEEGQLFIAVEELQEK